MRKEQYNLEDSIEECLEKYPGASAKKIFKFCKGEFVPVEIHSKATIYSRLRKMKKKRKVINKADSWFLLVKKDKD